MLKIRITFLKNQHSFHKILPVTIRVDGDGLFESSQTSSRPSHIVTLNAFLLYQYPIQVQQ